MFYGKKPMAAINSSPCRMQSFIFDPYQHGVPIIGETKTSEGNRAMLLPSSVHQLLCERQKKDADKIRFIESKL